MGLTVFIQRNIPHIRTECDEEQSVKYCQSHVMMLYMDLNNVMIEVGSRLNIDLTKKKFNFFLLQQ